MVGEGDLNPYLYPDGERRRRASACKAFYFAYFFRWSMLRELSSSCERRSPSRRIPPGARRATFTDFDSLDDKSDNLYYYMQYIKFGFGRAVRDACRMIQNDQMTRAEGLELARRYDGEFPERASRTTCSTTCR